VVRVPGYRSRGPGSILGATRFSDKNSRLGIRGRYPSIKTAAPAKQGSPHIGNFPRHTPVCELHKAFNIPYIYDHITKLCRKRAKITQNHGNANGRNIGKGEPRHRKFKRLRLGGGQAYHCSSVQIAQGESVFRLRNFNIVGFSTFILLRYMFRS
jgi:hypothetical protein